MNELMTPDSVMDALLDMERRGRHAELDDAHQGSVENSWTGITFRVGEHHLVVPLTNVKEIFPYPSQITPVPKSKSWIFGIVNLRGDLLPVTDLGKYLFDTTTTLHKQSNILVINDTNFSSGLLVDEVMGLKHFQYQQLPISDITPAELKAYIDGVVQQQDITWGVFSIGKLMKDDKFIFAAA